MSPPLKFHDVLPEGSTPVRREGLYLDRIPCCFVIKNTEGRMLLSMNQTGAIIWELCTGEWRVQDMIDALVESFEDVPRDEIERDVQRTLDTFRVEEVLEV